MTIIDQFDDPTATFVVALDPDGRPSVRSGYLPLPPGWTTLHRPDDFQACSDYRARYLAANPGDAG
ncbi:MbtH family NRPS accessory protein [Micromonospora sp. NPDC050980]|uniref:MbtH family NRPS accessory protein n=1 Tax=Micromonospora sp. NPDC050980 TaxID=3155161 RepID=UPI0033C2E55A